jgi:hypothetical protein
MLLATDQMRDTFVEAALGPRAQVRLLTQRAGEAQTQALPNQDYALLRSIESGRSLSFCVCDGVGSSYKGDFAAAFLAGRLVDWLAALPPPPPAPPDEAPADEAPADEARWDTPALHTRLATALLAWSHAGQEELRRVALPAGANGLVREVLEELREEYGSETVFLAGRADRADPSGATHLLFCWMGNVTAQVFGATGRIAGLCVADDDRNRWSTARRLRGALQVVSGTVPALQRLIVHTDGADSLGSSLAALADGELRERIQQVRESAASDDITILDVRWDHPSHDKAAHRIAHGIMNASDGPGRDLDRAIAREADGRWVFLEADVRRG